VANGWYQNVKTRKRLREDCLASARRILHPTSQELIRTKVGGANMLHGSKSYDIRAVELSGIGGHDQPERRHVFVGVHCPLCNTGYSVEIPPCENNDSILVEAIDGTLGRLDSCGSHPPEISFRIVGCTQLKVSSPPSAREFFLKWSETAKATPANQTPCVP
jgi:hypothetical protein